MKVYALFNDESALFGQIAGLRQQVAAAGKGRAAGDPLEHKLLGFDRQLDALRKQIVATTEGGAITGEERLREHTDQLYGALTSWDGPPTNYQLDNIAGLRDQLNDLTTEFSHLTARELPPLNSALRGQGTQLLAVPPLAVLDDDQAVGASRATGARRDPDAAEMLTLPADLRLWR